MFVIDFKIPTGFWEPVIQVEIRPCFEPILMAQIPSGCGSKLRGTKLQHMPGRMFVIEVVHLQCSKLFNWLECGMLIVDI